MPGYRAVLFDLDGTLLDSALDFYWVIDKMLADRKLPAVDRKGFRQHVSDGARSMVCFAFNLPADAPETNLLLEEFLSLYQQHSMVAATLFPELNSMLERLERRAIPWGIVTNKPERFCLSILDKLDLTHRCATLICPEHVKQRKPDPESLLLACEQLACPPSEALYLGDHQRDIEAGRRAGMTTAACLWGYIHANDNPRLWGADLIIEDTRELSALLN
ncbi:HAD family hydrolase [Marinobacterium mangrovicola]|uniref:Phosphoglycolate phosphatase n=1 Tax=Marinobacterium mangrovicola TaxID=1476959 RepID=A0A4V2PCY6_9GAMM|nr:HAD-IA family hydrolase [Marinobacterium mangrovicola]TCK03046.1 phosphoglycolate phosphatase [Marinobacterium mangrovicola]